MLALLLFTTWRTTATEAPVTVTESPAHVALAPPTAGTRPAVSPKISYVGGQLTIRALDSTLGDVLAKVAALTGVQIDVPEGANNEIISIVQLGPGPARQVLASLLSDAHFDYMIQESDTDSEKLQSVLIVPRKKRAGEASRVDAAARPFRSAYAISASQPAESEEAALADSPIPGQPENVPAEASASNPQIPSMQPEQSSGLPLQQRDQSNVLRPATLIPPQTLIPQSINQQLQQMYQQRVQMIQQDRQTVPPTAQR